MPKPIKKKQIAIIAGPSGSGETTFTEELMLAYPHFTRSVSATTRLPRAGEREGEDYYFMTKEKFFEAVQSGQIPEHTFVKNRDAHYGTYLPDLEKRIGSGKTVIVNTDLAGARFFKKQYDATTIFIKPKTMAVLYERLIRRDPNITKEEVISRLLSAAQETIEAENNYDYVVFNDDGEFADTMIKIVQQLRREGYDV
jgi:guanylate kinase